MTDFIFFPDGRFDKVEALEEASGIVREFLWLNDLPVPPIYRSTLSCRGLYRDGKIYIDLKGTIPPVKVPGYAWSFPGYKADITVYGVLAHETGHHVSAMRRSCYRIWRTGHSDPAVSSYGPPNHEEGLAEAIRLFILNPDLLRIGRPGMWNTLTTSYGLKPLHLNPWDEVLIFAHDRIIQQAEKWMVR